MAIDPDQIPINAEFQRAIDDLTRRLSAVEASGGGEIVYVPPDTIVQTFPDGTVVTYRKDS